MPSTEEYLGIQIDRSRDELFDELGMKRLRESYMTDEETSPQERLAFVATSFGSDAAHAQRLYEYASKHWLSFSTPILAFGRTKNGLPISCYLPYMHDSSDGLVNCLSEVNWLSMMGGGVGVGVGIRSADDKSVGVLPHLRIYDASSLAYRQGKTRRGSYAAFLDISHPDIIPFLEMRKATGDPNMRCLNLHHGINVTNDFMEIIERCMIDPDADDSWELKDPNNNEVRETVSAKDLWQRIMETRMLTGEPYLVFIDTANEALNREQKKLGLKIRQSNLCVEILLPTDRHRTAVCCLSSLNADYYNEWKKDELFIQDVAEMLDNVLQYFIDNAPNEIQRAKYSALRERSIGVGVLGFHSFLQSMNVPWESAVAKSINMQIFKHIRTELDKADLHLGKLRGEAPDMKGTGRRFAHKMALAPNASTSLILGNTSPSAEPFRANAYRQDTLSGSYLNKNRHLDKIIHEEQQSQGHPEQWIDDTWSDIIANDGSVQHLKWLADQYKEVFKTAMEIDQRWIVELAGDRQEYIDQGQSINLFFRPNAHIKYIHAVHFLAWKQKLKTLYYCRSEKIGKADKISKRIEREIIKEIDIQELVNDDECLACQ